MHVHALAILRTDRERPLDRFSRQLPVGIDPFAEPRDFHLAIQDLPFSTHDEKPVESSHSRALRAPRSWHWIRSCHALPHPDLDQSELPGGPGPDRIVSAGQVPGEMGM